MAMTYQAAKAKLAACGQEGVLRFWERLSSADREELLLQVDALEPAVLAQLQAQMRQVERAIPAAAIRPAVPAPADRQNLERARLRGAQALSAGQVGVILVAGGQGSRLGFDGPKGTFAIGPLSGASLFEIHARKILALQRSYGAPVPFFIMTSIANDADTRRFFEEHGYFGLKTGDVYFFSQGMFPALDFEGRIVMETPGRIFMAPDGHGGILAALERTGMLRIMRDRGLATLFYFQVDNPLVEIADPVFIGQHLEHGAEMSLKACVKRNPEEGLGVVVWRGDRMAVVEYTELTAEQKQARSPDGNLQFAYGSVAIHIFAREFLEHEAGAGLPLHLARKKVACCDPDGEPLKPDKPNACKFEKFIFDALPDARKPLLAAFAREEEFSPVKNATGDDSPATTRRDMMEKFARWLKACDVTVPRTETGELSFKIEIDPCYASDASELRSRLPTGFVWRGDLLLRE